MFKYKHKYIFLLLIIICFYRYNYTLEKFNIYKNINHIDGIYKTYNIVSIKNNKTKFYAQNVLNKNNFVFEIYNNLLSEEINVFNCYKIIGKDFDINSNINNSENNTYLKFNTEKFYAKDNVYKKVKINSIEKIDNDKCILSIDEKIYKQLYKFRNIIINKFLIIYDQPYAGFVAGILIAGKGLMSEETLEVFKRTSLSHIVVLSGSNVSIIIIFIKAILEIFFINKKNKKLIFIKNFLLIFFILTFSIITGGDPPIIRATISALIIIIFELKSFLSLTYVILIMFIINPFDFVYNPSTHLTFLATISLMIFSEKYIDIFRLILLRLRFILNIKSIIFLSNILGSTFATQILIAPYILLFNNSISPVFLLSNILILPIIPLIMLLGFINILFNNELIYYVNKYFLKYVFNVATCISDFDFSLIVLSKKYIIPFLSFYIIIFMLLNIYNSKK